MTVRSTAPIRPLGRVVPALEAGLYNDATMARAALERADNMRREILRQEAAAALDAARRAIWDRAQEAAIAVEVAFSARTARQIAELSPEIAKAISEGVERIIGGLNVDDAVLAAARCAVTALQDRVGLIIRVAPERFEAVHTTLSSEFSNNLRVLEDASLGPKDCVLETPGGTIQASLDEQIRILTQAYAAAVIG